ncbi:prolipoprotein diacylglyceryl transferase [Rhodocista pekingensis]|uniref:Phosphatidylglycerol--prolipoprotein diacylglyceryl transferase n=1 Tax=Rhodocista pekingensis TaxID=201185 RepID=A0ABW2KW44_9PROT
MSGIPFPALDPVAVELGPIVIRWYALAYLAGFLFGWWYCTRLSRAIPGRPTPDDLSEFLTWAIVGVLLGGRLGFVLFYNLDYYMQHPVQVLAIWSGGMSFHGGLAGIVLAILLYGWRHGFSPFALGDLVAVAGPVGLFLGRIANFVNGELWGRPAPDLPWGVIFPDPRAGGVPRHPSQLYEAALEGLVLFAVLAWLASKPGVRERTGTLSGTFLVGYGIARILGEVFREPDVQIGYLAFGVTMGQILSVPMVLIGLWILTRAPFGPARTPAAAATGR